MSSAIWFVKVNDQVYQADDETIKQWASYGNIQATDMVKKGNLNWIEANKVPILRDIFAHPHGYQQQLPQTNQPTMYQPTMYNGNYQGNSYYQAGYSYNRDSGYNANGYNGYSAGNYPLEFADEPIFSGSIKTFTYMLAGSLLLIPLLKIFIPSLITLIAVPLLLIGILVLFIYEIKFLVAAFREDLLWGIAVLVLKPVGLIFTIIYWQMVKRIVIMQLLGFIAVVIGAFGLYSRN